MTSKTSKLKPTALVDTMQIDTAIELLATIAAKTPHAARIMIEIESNSTFELVQSNAQAKKLIEQLRAIPDRQDEDPAIAPEMDHDAKLRHLSAYLACWRQSLTEAQRQLDQKWNLEVDKARVLRAEQQVALYEIAIKNLKETR